MADIGITEEGIEVAGILAMTWEEVDKQRNFFRFRKSVLVKINFRYGRVAEIEDCQIYDKEEWAKIYNALSGHSACYTDFAGKHSEVTLDFWDTVGLEEITDLDQIIDFHSRQGFYAHDLGIVEEALNQAIENGHIDEEYNRLDDEESDEED
jgi:hypothetical protein